MQNAVVFAENRGREFRFGKKILKSRIVPKKFETYPCFIDRGKSALRIFGRTNLVRSNVSKKTDENHDYSRSFLEKNADLQFGMLGIGIHIVQQQNNQVL